VAALSAWMAALSACMAGGHAVNYRGFNGLQTSPSLLHKIPIREIPILLLLQLPSSFRKGKEAGERAHLPT
jgi:hypothetical protein